MRRPSLLELAFMEVYTYVDSSDGDKAYFFDVTAMRKHLWSALPVFPPEVEIIRQDFDINPEFTEVVKRARGIERDHLQRIKGDPSKPVIAIHMLPDYTVTVDGHHNMLALARDGATHFHIARYRLGTWEQFLLDVPEPIRSMSLDEIKKEIEADPTFDRNRVVHTNVIKKEDT